MSSQPCDWTAHTVLALLFVGFAGAAAGTLALRQPHLQRGPASNGSAATPLRPLATLPALTVVTGDGKPVGLADGGGVVVVVSAGCPHCRRLLERLTAAAHGEPRSLQLVVLEGHAAAAELLGTSPFRPLAPLGEPRRFLGAIGAPGVPMLLWVDDHRHVLARTMGEISLDEARLWLERAGGGGRHGS